MNPSVLTRRCAVLLVLGCGSLLMDACGGGGGGSNGAESNTPRPPASTSTRAPTRTPGSAPTVTPGGVTTRTPTARRTSTPAPGTTRTPSATPTDTNTPEPTATATPTLAVVGPGDSIVEALRRAPPGATVVLSPGTYGPVALGPGDVQDSVTLLADVTGVLTDSSAAPVTIDARGRPSAFTVLGLSNFTIDGFTVRAAQTAGIMVTDSQGVTVRNCIIETNAGDGVRIQQSSAGLVFNNLVLKSGAAGVRIDGSDGARVINNTFYQNAGTGVVASGQTVVDVRNNIFDHNRPFGISTDPTRVAYQGDFNLNNDGYQALLPAPHDIVGRDPLFIFPEGEDFHVQSYSGGSTSPAVDAGDLNTDPALVVLLLQGSTQTTGTPDAPPVDLGYHYASVPGTPTPRPRPTRTATPRGTSSRVLVTATPTRTPTGPTPTATTTPVGRPTRTLRPTRTPR